MKGLFHRKILSTFLLIVTQKSNPNSNAYFKTIPKLNPNPNPNLLILTLKKANEKSADEYFSFSFYSLLTWKILVK